MIMMRRRRVAVSFASCCCLLLTGVHGYIPSRHSSSKVATHIPATDVTGLGKKLKQQTPILSTTATTTRLKPVLETNPLESYHLQQQQQQPPKQDAITVTTTTVDQEKQAIFVSCSAALAGFTDVVCLAQFGCFVNMMTGNLLKMTTSLANGQFQPSLMHALTTLSYMLGVAIFARLQRDDDQDTTLRSVAPIVALLFGMADLLAGSWQQVPCLACGFGVLNTAASQATGGTIFFALTGHLTKITNAITTMTPWDAATKKSWQVVQSFLGGAFVAALLVRRLGTTPILGVGTTLGLLYAGLFGWYAGAPVALLQRLKKSVRRTRTILRPAFAGRHQPKKQDPTWLWNEIPNPIQAVVEIYPSQDLLYPANATQSG